MAVSVVAVPGQRSRVALASLIGLVALSSYLLFYLVVSATSAMPTAVLSPAEYRGHTSPYSFDLDLAVHPSWMASVPDSANLTSLSIPGTHDSLTHAIVSDKFQCQNWNLATQLRAGLRYFDVRARLVANASEPTLAIYHASMPTGYTFADVLFELFGFLDEHPTEGIIMRLKEEGPPVGLPDDPPPDHPDPGATVPANRTFEDVFNHYRLNDSRTAAGSASHLLAPPRKRAATFPTVGQLRGKILLLQEFASAPNGSGPYGVAWGSPSMKLEDMWIMPDLSGLELKWAAIREALANASRNPNESDVLFLSHLSAAVGVLPIDAAAGPPANRTIVGMNDRTGMLLDGRDHHHDADDDDENLDNNGKIGVVVADFPGRLLVDAILRRNRWLNGQSKL